MSAGIGHYLNKNTKMRLAQKMADRHNEEMGYNDPNYYENFDTHLPKKERPENKEHIFSGLDPNTVLCFEDGKNVYPNLGHFNMGLTNSHKGPSEKKLRDQPVERYYKSKKDPELRKEFENIEKQKKDDMKSQLNRNRDHLDELFDEKLTKDEPKNNLMRDQYVFTEHMQKECDNVNFDCHLLKNDLNQFTEAYMKYKDTMRTFTNPNTGGAKK